MSRYWSPSRNAPAPPALATLALLALVCLPVSRAAAQVCCDPWVDLGHALPGTHGAPLLDLSGSLADATLVTLDLDNALENSLVWLILGLGQADVPFLGGVLVPSPDIVRPFATNGQGMLGFSVPWPSGLLAGTAVVLQAWVNDPLAPQGYAASNAVLGVTPDPPPPGNFPADWIYGGNCGSDPSIQVQQYDTNTYILRQSQCTNFEGPFMFLLFGQDKVLLYDTGAGGIPIRNTVNGIIASWKLAHGVTATLPLVVAHTHGHGDHIAGDSQFVGQPDTTVVGTSATAVMNFFGFQDWPNDIVSYDLGGRVLDVLAIPGHQSAHIALYDHETALLLTGDTLYPGFLFISGAVSGGNFAKYQASAQRLVDFIADKPVQWVFGTHVEMKNTPGEAYPYGTNNQPLEHDPQLLRSHLLEWNAAVQAMGSSPHVEVHDDFIIQPSG